MNKRFGALTIMVLLLWPLLALGSTGGPGLSASEVLFKLKEGNARFAKDLPSEAVISHQRRLEITKGQNPYVTILGCSDSRESLEHIFAAGLGELFVIRVAGNVADTDEIGSLEYGVDHLGTPILLVLGHTACGAVTAVATHAEVHGHIPALVDNIIPAVDSAKKRVGANASKDELVATAINANIFQSMADILSKSAIIAQRVRDGKVKVIGALYHLDSGTIDWLGEHPEQETLAAQALAAGSGHGGHASAQHGASSLALKLLIGCFMMLAIFAIFFFFFIAENRLFKALRFKSRLMMSFVALLAGLSVFLVYLFDLHKAEGVSLWTALCVPFGLMTALSFMLAMTHHNAFKRFFAASMMNSK